MVYRSVSIYRYKTWQMPNLHHKVTSWNYSDVEANKGGAKAAVKQSPKKSSFSKENIITKLDVEQWGKNVTIAVKQRTWNDLNHPQQQHVGKQHGMNSLGNSLKILSWQIGILQFARLTCSIDPTWRGTTIYITRSLMLKWMWKLEKSMYQLFATDLSPN